MGAKTAISWTDSSWNPVRGCTRVSPGCGGPGKAGGCYAEKIAARFSDPGQPFHGFAERTKDGGRWTGKLALVDNALTLPLHWRKPRRIFVNSMSDLFHESLPDEAIDRVFAVMALCPQHTFQVLTKRAERMRAYLTNIELNNRVGSEMADISDEADRAGIRHEHPGWGFELPSTRQMEPLPNVWLGVSCEDQRRADERLPDLEATPAAVRFASFEPLLGEIKLWHVSNRATFSYPGLGWAIVGGESGPNARPMHPDWARSLRDQCAAAGVPFFFKQWGEWQPFSDCRGSICGLLQTLDDKMVRVGKKRAGCKLDGIEHLEFPEVLR